MQNKKEHEKELIDLIQKIAPQKELLREFLIDLLSPTEFKQIVARWQIVKQLSMYIPQKEIAENLHVGLVTINRGVKELLNENGGFRAVLRKFYNKI